MPASAIRRDRLLVYQIAFTSKQPSRERGPDDNQHIQIPLPNGKGYFFAPGGWRAKSSAWVARFNLPREEVIQVTKNKTKKKAVIAYRKACKASGTGLSHFILMGKKSK